MHVNPVVRTFTRATLKLKPILTGVTILEFKLTHRIECYHIRTGNVGLKKKMEEKSLKRYRLLHRAENQQTTTKKNTPNKPTKKGRLT